MKIVFVLVAVFSGVIGFGYFVYGMKEQQATPLFCGIGLCLVPFFIGNALVAGAVSLVLTAIPIHGWLRDR